MTETPMRKTRNKLAKMYGIGIVVFSGAVGFITLLGIFLANVKIE